MLDPFDPEFRLETPRIILRHLRESDRAELNRIEKVGREHFAPWAPSSKADETPDDWFDDALKRTAETLIDQNGLRLVGFTPEGQFVGNFNLNGIVRGVSQVAYMGWRVNVELINRGYATEGVRALMAISFAAEPRGLGLHRLAVAVIPENVRSRRVAAKCGFREEGLALRMLNIAGAWRDHVLYAMTVEEFEE